MTLESTIKFYAGGFILFNICDIITTYVGVMKLGAKEQNIIYSALFDAGLFWNAMFDKIIMTLLIAYFIYNVAEKLPGLIIRKKKISAGVLITVCAFLYYLLGTVVILNSLTIIDIVYKGGLL